MSVTKVIVDKSKLDTLNDSISSKLGTSVNRTLDEMDAAVAAIPTGTPLPPLTNPASASDVLDGKEAIDGQGQVLTGTLVPPVDTGANGLYKSIIENPITELSDTGLTKIAPTAFYNRSGLRKISLPNCTEVGNYAFGYCTLLTGILNFGNSVIRSSCFASGLTRTVVLIFKNNTNGYAFQNVSANHIYLPTTESCLGAQTINSRTLKTIQFDAIACLSLQSSVASNLRTFIIRTPQGCALSARSNNLTNIIYYVPKDILISYYSTATNWVTDYNAGRIKGIDEDITGTVGQTFTPTTSATVDHWDQVDLQSYSVGTVDTATGAITPTHDGRLLIRGLDASDNIVHVTYLQIGTGFDTEANLA